MQTNTETTISQHTPDISIAVRQTFGIDSDMEVPAFSQAEEHVPEIDGAYQFNHDMTVEISPFMKPLRVRLAISTMAAAFFWPFLLLKEGTLAKTMASSSAAGR